MITQKKLKEALHYNPDTGVFTWVKAPKNKSQLLGCEAGSVNDKGYRIITVHKDRYRAHHLAWLYTYGYLPKYQVDHKDHNTSNNAISNLRLATQAINMRNRSKDTRNKSGHTGVVWDKTKGKWLSQIGYRGKHHMLGRFDNIEDAIKVRLEAEKRFNFHPNHGK